MRTILPHLKYASLTPKRSTLKSLPTLLLLSASSMLHAAGTVVWETRDGYIGEFPDVTVGCASFAAGTRLNYPASVSVDPYKLNYTDTSTVVGTGMVTGSCLVRESVYASDGSTTFHCDVNRKFNLNQPR